MLSAKNEMLTTICLHGELSAETMKALRDMAEAAGVALQIEHERPERPPAPKIKDIDIEPVRHERSRQRFPRPPKFLRKGQR
jgi:hypothetical protein